MSSGNLLEEFKMRLSADPLPNCKVYGDRKAAPQLAIRIKDNQPRFVVYTNVENDKNNGIIEAPMDSVVFMTVMQIIRDVADGRSKGNKIHNRGHYFSAQGRSAEPGVLSVTSIGINDNGIICMSVVAKGRPEAVFKFGPHEWHPMMDASGNAVTVQEQSRLFALGYVNLMEKCVVRVLGDEFINYTDLKARKEANRAARSGGNGGSGARQQYGNNGGGGYNANPAPKPSDSEGDGMPW